MKSKKSAYNKIILSTDQEKFIRQNFHTMRTQQLADAIGLKITKVRMFAYAMGLKKMDPEYFTEEQVLFVRRNYQWYGDTEIAEIFNQFFPKNKGWSKKHIEKKRRYLKLKRTKLERDNIRDRNVKMGRFAECANKRWAVTGIDPAGTIKIHKYNGCKVAVIKTEKGYVHRNRWLWEQFCGPVLKGEVVRTLPGAPLVCDIEHLEKVTRAENAWKNQLSDSSIIKRKFKIQDPAAIAEYAENNPNLIEVHRNIQKIKRTINERRANN